MRNEEIIKIQDLGICFCISTFIQIIFPFFISYDSFRINGPSVIPVLFFFAPMMTLIFMILFMTGLYKKKRIDNYLVIVSNIIFVVLKNYLYEIYSNGINSKSIFLIDIISLIILIGIIVIFDYKRIIARILLLLKKIFIKYAIANKIMNKTNICIKRNMTKYLFKLYLYCLTITFIICFFYAIKTTTVQLFTPLNAVFFTMIIYSVICLIMLVPFAISKLIYSDFCILENILFYFIYIIILFEKYFICGLLNLRSSERNAHIIWLLLYAVYIVLRPYLKQKTRLIPCLINTEKYITSKKGTVCIICTIIILLFILIFNDNALRHEMQ